MPVEALVTTLTISLGGLIGFTVFFFWLFLKTKKKKYIFTSVIGLIIFISIAVYINVGLLPTLSQ